MLNQTERQTRSRAAAYAMHAKHDPKTVLAAAHQATRDKYYRRVDPDNTLPNEERERRARAAMRSDLELHELKRLQALRAACARAKDERAAQRAAEDAALVAAAGALGL